MEIPELIFHENTNDTQRDHLKVTLTGYYELHKDWHKSLKSNQVILGTTIRTTENLHAIILAQTVDYKVYLALILEPENQYSLGVFPSQDMKLAFNISAN